jgi:L-idonate 5-dehydrogenase
MIACVIHGAKDLRFEKRPDPQPGEGEVLVRFGAGGVCGSDLHYYHDGSAGDFTIREPLTLGHEVAGGSSMWEKMLQSSASASVWLSIQRDPASSATTVLAGKSHLCVNVLFYGSAARFPHVQGAFSELFVARPGGRHQTISPLTV